MSPRTIGEVAARETPLLRGDQEVSTAVRAVVESGLPALPVVDADGRYVGVFGEREFMTALFPGYLGELASVRFVPRSLEEQLDKRQDCLAEPVSRYMNDERIGVGEDWSDAQLAETFLHHRVLIIPVVDAQKRVLGIVTRSDFFKTIARYCDV